MGPLPRGVRRTGRPRPKEETEQRLLELGRTIQRSYGSWREMVDNYRGGRDFWIAYGDLEAKDVGDILHVTRKLLSPNDRASPFNRIAWARNLD